MLYVGITCIMRHIKEELAWATGKWLWTVYCLKQLWGIPLINKWHNHFNILETLTCVGSLLIAQGKVIVTVLLIELCDCVDNCNCKWLLSSDYNYAINCMLNWMSYFSKTQHRFNIHTQYIATLQVTSTWQSID